MLLASGGSVRERARCGRVLKHEDVRHFKSNSPEILYGYKEKATGSNEKQRVKRERADREE